MACACQFIAINFMPSLAACIIYGSKLLLHVTQCTYSHTFVGKNLFYHQKIIIMYNEAKEGVVQIIY